MGLMALGLKVANLVDYHRDVRIERRLELEKVYLASKELGHLASCIRVPRGLCKV